MYSLFEDIYNQQRLANIHQTLETHIVKEHERVQQGITDERIMNHLQRLKQRVEEKQGYEINKEPFEIVHGI
ncbi:MAG TPA: hypothetical protein VLG50_04085 [Candidatus Saccharimonadales bacterium]|nr:hypothetical protein [Candidatus Saccharimonadales bacterium]